MATQRSGKLPISSIADAINRLAGKPAWSLRWQDIVTVLHSSLAFREGIHESDSLQMVQALILDPALKTPISASSILQAITRAENNFFSVRTKPFVVHCKLSLRWHTALRPVTMGRAKLRFLASAPNSFRQCQIPGTATALETEPLSYTSVLIAVRNRSPIAALESGLLALDELRSFWNLLINQTVWNRFGGRRPVNEIRLGAVQTLHHSSGRAAIQDFLHDPHAWLGAPLSAEARWARIVNGTKTLRHALTAHPYRADLVSAIVRYGRALDSDDPDVSFLQLWGVMEVLTGAGSHHDLVVSRTKSLHRLSDQEFNRVIVQQLREYRNQVAHDSVFSLQASARLFQLKRYVERWFWYHLGLGSRCPSMAEAAALMDLPSGRRHLRKQVARINLALSYRR